MQWVTADSQMVARYAYDAATSRLYMDWNTGGGGYYEGIPPDVYAAFHDASSKGQFVLQRLKDNPRYPWVRLAAAPRKLRVSRAPRVRRPRSRQSGGVRYRYRCVVCSAIRTLDSASARMPKHKQKGSGRFGLTCPGSGTPAIPLGPTY